MRRAFPGHRWGRRGVGVRRHQGCTPIDGFGTAGWRPESNDRDDHEATTTAMRQADEEVRVTPERRSLSNARFAATEVDEPFALEAACGRADRVGIVLAEALGSGTQTTGRRRGDGRDKAAAKPAGRRTGTARRCRFGSTATTMPCDAHRVASGQVVAARAREACTSPRRGPSRHRASDRAAARDEVVGGRLQTRQDAGTPTTSRRRGGRSRRAARPAHQRPRRRRRAPCTDRSPAATRAPRPWPGTRPPWSATIVRAHSRNARARRL